MRLSENQALDIYEEACYAKERLLSTRQGVRLVWGTDLMQRHALHILRQAEKKQAKRERAKRGKSVRPFVRFFLDARVSDELENVPPSVLIQVGDDTETYEPETVRRAEERIRQREDAWDDLFREDAWNDPLHGVALNNAYTDYDDESWDDYDDHS